MGFLQDLFPSSPSRPETPRFPRALRGFFGFCARFVHAVHENSVPCRCQDTSETTRKHAGEKGEGETVCARRAWTPRGGQEQELIAPTSARGARRAEPQQPGSQLARLVGQQRSQTPLNGRVSIGDGNSSPAPLPPRGRAASAPTQPPPRPHLRFFFFFPSAPPRARPSWFPHPLWLLSAQLQPQSLRVLAVGRGEARHGR